MKLDRRTLLAGALASGATLVSCSQPGATADSEAAPEPSPIGGWTPPDDRTRKALVAEAHFGRKAPVSSRSGLAVCTHPLASAAAADMLRLGGNAVDGVLAASIAQAVVEPHMTTLTGCLSMLYYDAEKGESTYVNGMMATPKAHPFLEEPDFTKLLGMSRTGELAFVPGFWGGFEAAHERYGALDRKTVMAPAIHYARDGFEIHPFLWGEMFVESAALGAVSESREMYFRDGALLNVGDRLVQQRHADTLERLAEEGGEYFYRGEFASRYAEAVQQGGGYVTKDDMAAYEAFWDEPVRTSYRDFEVVASPSPDYGGQVFCEIMNMVELIDLQAQGPAFESAETTLKMMQIIGQVFVDSTTANFSKQGPSVERALSKEYAEERFAKLSGKPKSPYDAFAAPPPPPGSNHVTVVDAAGNVATVLHSVMSLPFTTRIYVDGVYVCASGVHLGSGTPEPGGRAFARICPNMFLENGKPVLASGSPSVSLTENIVQSSVNLLDFGLDIETTVHKPRFGGSSMNDFSALMIEADMGEKTIADLRASGARLEVVNPWNWTHGSFDGIRVTADGTASACGDPRRTAQAKSV